MNIWSHWKQETITEPTVALNHMATGSLYSKLQSSFGIYACVCIENYPAFFFYKIREEKFHKLSFDRWTKITSLIIARKKVIFGSHIYDHGFWNSINVMRQTFEINGLLLLFLPDNLSPPAEFRSSTVVPSARKCTNNKMLSDKIMHEIFFFVIVLLFNISGTCIFATRRCYRSLRSYETAWMTKPPLWLAGVLRADLDWTKAPKCAASASIFQNKKNCIMINLNQILNAMFNFSFSLLLYPFLVKNVSVSVLLFEIELTSNWHIH